MTSVIPENHKTLHHTKNEKCKAGYVLCSDTTCIMYQKHMVCSDHPFHPGDRVVNWEFKNKYGYVYYTKPNVVSSNQIVYIKYDKDNQRIHARFGKCACGDVFLLTDQPRDLTKSRIQTKFTKYFPIF